MKTCTVAVDVDEVVANLLGEWLRRYNREYGDCLVPEDIRGWDFRAQLKGHARMAGIHGFLYDKDLYEHVLPMPGAKEAIGLLRHTGARVVFVTSCVEGTADAKLSWLRRWGFLDYTAAPDHNFIAAADKSLVRADYLLDDRIENAEGFAGQGILIDHPHNREYRGPCPRMTLYGAVSLIMYREKYVDG